MEGTTLDLEILERMLEALGSRNDSELARFLGVSPQAISKSRSAGKIPAPWPLKFAKSAEISLDWLCFGRGMMRNRERSEGEISTIASAESTEACPRCAHLEQRLEATSDKLVETLQANVALVTELGQQKLENVKLVQQLDTARQMCREYAAALKKIGAADPIFDEPQIIPPSNQLGR